MSLKAIAKELGISVTTVSRALNGYDDVSQETRARVEAEAKRRGYRPNTFARRLKMGKIDAVGLVFPVRPAPLNNTVFLEMVGEISHELARYEIDLLLIADDEQADKHGYMRMVQSRRVDALIVAHTLDDDPRLTQLFSCGFPFLALGRSRLPQPYAWFDFDNYAGTYRATRHLIGGAIGASLCWEKTTAVRLSLSGVTATRRLARSRSVRKLAAQRAAYPPWRIPCYAGALVPAGAADGDRHGLQYPRRRRGNGALATGAPDRR